MDKFVININGEFFSEKTAKISIFDRGFLYGDSVYEATRTFNRIPFRLDLHIDRLFESAQKIDFLPSLSKEFIKDQIQKTIDYSPHPNITLRIILSRGTNNDLGLDPALATENSLFVITKPIAENPSWWLEKGWSVIFFRKKSSERGPLPKTGNYQENMLAYKEAKIRGADDAIMLNSEGFLCEGTTSNVWIFKNNELLTPDLSLGLLDGLTRRAIFEVCSKHNIPCKEAKLTQGDFLSADEAFITSTTRNLVPVTKIEGNPIGTGRPGAKTLQLLNYYLDYVAKEY
jgi:branched-chain amino acid aminotransferase